MYLASIILTIWGKKSLCCERAHTFQCLKIKGDGILKKISYVLKSVLVWSLKVCK